MIRVPRLARSELPEEGIFHITAHATGREILVVDDADRRLWFHLLQKSEARHELASDGGCLMDTHYHLLYEGKLTLISRLLHWLNGTYSREFNARHERRGHLLRERFSAWVIRDEKHLEETIRYIRCNPVRAGICGEPEQWPWSWPRLDIA